MEEKKYNVEVSGCDDSTDFIFECTEQEKDTLVRFAKECNKFAEEAHCKPNIYLYEEDGTYIVVID